MSRCVSKVQIRDALMHAHACNPISTQWVTKIKRHKSRNEIGKEGFGKRMKGRKE